MVILTLIFILSPWKDAEDAFYLKEYEKAALFVEPYIEESKEAYFLYLLSLLRAEKYEMIRDFLVKKPPHALVDFELLSLIYSSYKLHDKETFFELREKGRRLFFIEDLLLYFEIEVLTEEGDIEEALRRYRRLEEFFPHSDLRKRSLFIFLDTLSIIFPDSAIHIMENALPILKGDMKAEVLFKLASLSPRKKRSFLLIELVKNHPESPYALRALEEIKVSPLFEGIVYCKNKRYKKAWKSLRKIPWDSGKGSYYKFLTLYRLERYRDYLYNFEKVKKKLRERFLPPLLFYAALSAEYLGRYTAAYHYLEDLIKKRGRWGEKGIYKVTLLFMEKRETRWASARFKESLRKFPPGEIPLFDLRRGLVSILLKRTGEAQFLFEKALKDTGFVKSQSLYWLFKITGDSTYAYTLRKEYPLSYYTLLLFPPFIKDNGRDDIEIPQDFRLRIEALLFIGEDKLAYKELSPYKEWWDWGAFEAKKFGIDHLAIRLSLKKNNNISLLFPSAYLPLIEKVSEEIGLEKEIILAISREESWFDRKAISPKGACGLMQILPKTARREALRLNLNFKEKEDLFDPKLNILIGAHYFKKLLIDFESYVLALAAYNAGPKRVEEWINKFGSLEESLFVEFIPYEETRNYVRRVMRSYFLYREILK